MTAPLWNDIVKKFVDETEYYSFLASDPIFVERVYVGYKYSTRKKVYASLEDSQLFHSIDFGRLGKSYSKSNNMTKQHYIEKGRKIAKTTLAVHTIKNK